MPGLWNRHSLLGKHDLLMRLQKASADLVVQLNEEQVAALERFSPEFRERHIEADYTGNLLSGDTFFVGDLKASSFAILLAPPASIIDHLGSRRQV